MRVINKNTTSEDLVSIVAGALASENIKAVLTGGAVVSIYTENKYESKDLDFISPAGKKEIQGVMTKLGFHREGKDFVHPESKFTVEFPSGPLGIGARVPVEAQGEKVINGVTVKMGGVPNCGEIRLA